MRLNTIALWVCAVMTSASLTAQTLVTPQTAKEIKAKKAAELKEFKARQKAELAEFIERQKNPKLDEFKVMKPELKDEGDSIAYLFGAYQANGLKKYLNDQMKVDTTNAKIMESFYKGLLEKVSLDPNDKMEQAHQVGLQIGQRIDDMTKSLTKDFYAADSDKTISTVIVGNSIVSALMGQNEYAINQAQTLFQEQMSARQKANMERLYGENRRAGEQFLADNAKKPDVKTTASGLQYKVITQGTGPIPTASQKVKVHYEGRLIDGTVFDSSYSRGNPSSFGVRQVIPGWTEALCLMPVGSKWEIYIPYKLAYGESDQGKIKPYSALSFTIELLGIE